MSFDLFLQHFRGGVPAQADRAAVRQVVDRHGAVRPDRYGQYDVPLPDGEIIQLAAPALDAAQSFEGCAFHLRGFSLGYCHFILALARAGDMVIFNAQGTDEPANPVLILSIAGQEHQTPPGICRHPVLAQDGLHLYTLLDGGYEAWERYRAQAIARAPRGT